MATATQTLTQSQASLSERFVRFWNKYLLFIYTGGAIVYLMAPVAVMILFSFNDPAGKSNFVWQGFTLAAWLDPFGVAGLESAVMISIAIALLSTLVATALGTAIALALARHDFVGRSSTNLFIFLPMATPEIVLGRLTADAVRGDRRSAVLPAQLHHDPHRSHHVQHQLRGRHRPRPAVRFPDPPRGGGDGPRRERAGPPSAR